MVRREVFLKTANLAFVNQDQNRADAATVLGQHWLVCIGDYHYQSGATHTEGKTNPINEASIHDRVAGVLGESSGSKLIGYTNKSDKQLKSFVDQWNRPGQKGSQAYCLVSNSCQHFAKDFSREACDGQCSLPESFGGRMVLEPGKRVDVSFGTGELLAARKGGVDAHLSGPGIGVSGDRNKGVKVKAELFNNSVQLGAVGANVSPNLNTGAGYDGRNVEASFLGLGGKVGADGLNIATPLGGITLKFW